MTIEPFPLFDLVSVVATFDPSTATSVSLGGDDIEAMEDILDASLVVGQVVGSAGVGSSISVPRRQQDISILQDRFEVRNRSPELSDAVARQMLELFDAVVTRLGDHDWRSIGYNFITTVHTEGPASLQIKNAVLRDDFENAVPYPVTGAAAWLWIEVEDSTLWLRLEPLRSSPTTARVPANANFRVELAEGTLTPARDIQANILRYAGAFGRILAGMGL